MTFAGWTRPCGWWPSDDECEEFGAALKAAAEAIAKDTGGAVTALSDSYVGEPHLADTEGPLVTTLLDIYQRRRGGEPAPLSIRGGTYARLFPGAVDFGPSFPGEPYAGHAPDESISLSSLREAVLMLGEATYRLAVR
ncbi:MAG: hypothetical protein HYZ28_09445 [Myxococcales bacterium]|nr:hypothetical protein [Myxococcales bacterium]